jgi:hypothetical protein
MSIAAQRATYAPAHALTLDFLRWVAEQPRSYEEAMEGWRTSCPRLSIWEDALADGLVAVTRVPGMSGDCVSVTSLGRELLDQALPGIS